MWSAYGAGQARPPPAAHGHSAFPALVGGAEFFSMNLAYADLRCRRPYEHKNRREPSLRATGTSRIVLRRTIRVVRRLQLRVRRSSGVRRWCAPPKRDLPVNVATFSRYRPLRSRTYGPPPFLRPVCSVGNIRDAHRLCWKARSVRAAGDEAAGVGNLRNT